MRTSAAAVKQIFDTDLTNSDIEPFITAANLMVTNTLSGEGLSTATLTEIERYLAAHFADSWDQRLAEQRFGDGTQATFQGEYGQGLRSTKYGQHAMLLDTTGKLAGLGKTRVSMTTVTGEDV